jgi:hypothetical protein
LDVEMMMKTMNEILQIILSFKRKHKTTFFKFKLKRLKNKNKNKNNKHPHEII